MKKLLLTACAVACTASVFAQGTVVLNNRITGEIITHIYLGTSQKSGNGTADFPAGTTDWTGFTALSGSGYSAALCAATGAGAALSSLTFGATPTITTFRTGTGAGFLAGTTATLNNIAKDAAVATIALFVWDNKGGTLTDAAAVLTSYRAGSLASAAGLSPAFDVSAVGGDVNTPPSLLGLKSFSIAAVPEPSTLALAGLGLAGMMIFRRRK